MHKVAANHCPRLRVLRRYNLGTSLSLHYSCPVQTSHSYQSKTCRNLSERKTSFEFNWNKKSIYRAPQKRHASRQSIFQRMHVWCQVSCSAASSNFEREKLLCADSPNMHSESGQIPQRGPSASEKWWQFFVSTCCLTVHLSRTRMKKTVQIGKQVLIDH